MIKSYKDLVVWQKSIDLVESIYLTTKQFPRDEQYGLISQMRRCVVSIPSNIAEGTSRGTRKDYCQFLRIALGSSAELETHIIIAERLEYLTALSSKNLFKQVNEIMKILNSIIRKL